MEAVPEVKQVRIGEYVVTGKIGQGGIAEIYKGRQESLERDVAIKVLSGKLCRDPELVRRFERESIVIARLNHPNIVHVIDRGQAGNRYYFVMEFVDGTSLREVIDSPKIELNVKIEMIAQVCKALDYAHKNGIIHRDIKPANILIDKQGNARVADFGIAQIVGTPDSETTSSDIVMGTLSYMSPEQKTSSTNVDQTTDIYAIGVIIYEILAGKKPLGRFALPSELNPAIDKAFDRIVQRCLAQEAKDRYQSAVQLKNDLLNIIGGGTTGLAESQNVTVRGSDSFTGKCRYLDTIRETRFSSTILVENRVNKQLYVIKKHTRGEAGRKEAKLLTSLKHENIINVIGSGGDNKTTVVISEYAQGGSLADRMVRKYDWRKGMDVAMQIAAGLHFAHRNNIIHGNLRPSNILFSDTDEVKISDFGLPEHYGASSKKNWYTSPERKISKHADIYALGVIIHQMVTGRTPQYDTGGNLILDELAIGIPEDFVLILKRLLAIRVSNRYSSLEEMVLDWDAYESRIAEAQQLRPVFSVDSRSSTGQEIPRWAIAITVAGSLFILALILYWSGIFG